MSLFKPRPHASIEEIKREAANGNAFFVNRAAENGDLACLSDMEARRIVATANDQFALTETWRLVSKTPEGQVAQFDRVEDHIQFAARVFCREGGKPISQQIGDHYRRR